MAGWPCKGHRPAREEYSLYKTPGYAATAKKGRFSAKNQTPKKKYNRSPAATPFCLIYQILINVKSVYSLLVLRLRLFVLYIKYFPCINQIS